ncbi:MAG: Ig-like domain-containing protein, partial [Polyangiaceae bacterium]|nr:Ig-like domain-containing protein [Polyangiaceae bacterium]
QSCIGGLWNTCDCSECSTGSKDCLGGVVARECIAGRWVTSAICQGPRPICAAGQCFCENGGDDCDAIPDIIPPAVIISSPVDSSLLPAESVSAVALVFNEDIIVPEGSDAALLYDSLGRVVAGEASYSSDTIVFTPQQPLRRGTSYEVRVAPEVSDLQGNAVGSGVAVGFETSIPNRGTPVFSQEAYQLGSSVPARHALGPDGDAYLICASAEQTPDWQFINREHHFLWQDGEFSEPFTRLPSYSGLYDLIVNADGSLTSAHSLGGNVIFYRFDGEEWSITPEHVLWGAQASEYTTRSNYDGDILVISDVAGAYTIDSRANGTWLATRTLQEDAALVPDVALGPEGHGAVVIVESEELTDSVIGFRYSLSGPDLTGWSDFANLPLAVNPSEVSTLLNRTAAVDSSGNLFFYYSLRLNDGSDQHYMQRVLAAEAGQSPGASASDWNHSEPGVSLGIVHISGDKQGGLIAAYEVRVSSTSDFYARHYDAATASWASPVAILPNAGEFGSYIFPQLRMTDDGHATAVVQYLSGSVHALRGSKFSPETGWQPQALYQASVSESFVGFRLAANNNNLTAIFLEPAGASPSLIAY